LYNTSQQIKDAMYALSRRLIAKVTFGINDVTAYGDVSSIVGSSSSYDNINQVVNRVREPSYKLATYEDNLFSLDGTVTFLDDNPVNNGEIGFVSNKLCDSLCRFSTPNKGMLLNGDTPIPNIQFSIRNTVTNDWHDCTSDANGIFSYTHVPDGTYTIEGVWINPTWHTLAAKIFTLSNGLESGIAELEFNIAGYSKPVQAPVTLTVEFNGVHSSAGITVTFDSVLGEYAVDYDVEAYDFNGAIITKVNIVNNTEIIHQALGQLYGYKKLVITVKKWSKPYRRARILEVDFGIVKIYTDDNLIRLNLLEDLDLTSGQIPSAEFRFEVDNADRAFNILNPTGFYKYLKERQSIYASVGIEHDDGSVNFIPLGEYFLAEWMSNEGALTATFTARTILDIMASYPYENLTAREISLKQLAEEVFLICKVTSYEIDSSLESVMINGLVKRTDCKTVLQMIAIAGCSNIITTRTGVIKLIKADTIGETIDNINFDNVYNEPQINLEKIVKTAEVTFWKSLEQSTIVSVVVPGINEGETLSLTENTLINSAEQANKVANWLLSQRNNRRAKYFVNFRGNPAHELADVIDIENSYGTDKKAIITKLDMSYEGYFNAKIEAKGMDE
jgi:hypothetical protein